MDFLRSDIFLVLVVLLSTAAVILGAVNLMLNLKIKRTFSELGIGSKNETLQRILEEYLMKLNQLDSKSLDIEDYTKKLSSRLNKKLGRVGFMRFNPYGDTGGDQSFSSVFLDDEDNGVLITTLFRRGQTQTFAKKIIGGKSESALTDEEKQVINEAISS